MTFFLLFYCFNKKPNINVSVSIDRLDIRTNNICGKGLCSLTDAMKMNYTLTKVYIWGNNLEESAAIVSFTVLLLLLLYRIG